jgi:hypothetical protein
VRNPSEEKQEKRDTHAYKSDDVRVTEVAKELEFFDIHCNGNRVSDSEDATHSDLVLTCVQLPSELRDSHFPIFQLTKEHVFESTAPDLRQLRNLVGRDLPVM